MDFSSYKSEYDMQGFVVIREFLPPQELDRLQRELQRYIREVVPTLPDGDAFYEDRSRPETLKQMHRLEQDAFFADYLREPRWRLVAEALLGEPIQPPQNAEWFNKPPLTNHITPPHQDNYYFCLKPPQVLTIWLALDAVDEENGCLRYIPGSHRLGIRPHGRTQTLGFSQGILDYGEADYAKEVAITAQPGDALIHHGNTIHRADANRSSTRQRRSFGVVCRGVSCQRDENAYERYLQSVRGQQAALGLKI